MTKDSGTVDRWYIRNRDPRELLESSNDDSFCKRIVVFDLDGTLANVDARRKKAYVEETDIARILDDKPKWKFDWSIFHDPENVMKDKPNDVIIEMCRALYLRGYRIYITSGRTDKLKDVTREWLDKYKVPYDRLYMRTKEDRYIKDSTLKEKWLKEFEYPVQMAVDDRTSVVNMWRRNGIEVLALEDRTVANSTDRYWKINENRTHKTDELIKRFAKQDKLDELNEEELKQYRKYVQYLEKQSTGRKRFIRWWKKQ